MEKESRKLYLSEFSHYCGTHYITFNILDISIDEITVAISDEGKITRRTFDLKSNDNGLYFEYGIMLDKISANDFEQVEN